MITYYCQKCGIKIKDGELRNNRLRCYPCNAEYFAKKTGIFRLTRPIKKDDKYRCTNCKRTFKTKKQGENHFKVYNHKWGGLEHLKQGGKKKMPRTRRSKVAVKHGWGIIAKKDDKAGFTKRIKKAEVI